MAPLHVCCALTALYSAVALQRRVHETKETSFRQTLKNVNDLNYYGDLKVGGQELSGIFDTGSIELVVLSEECGGWCGSDKKTLYSHSKSSLYIHGGLGHQLSYGSGDLLGKEAYDSLSIGPFYAKTAPFWEVVDASMPLLYTTSFQAIIGLGPLPAKYTVMKFGADNSHSYATALDSLNLSRSQFGMCLGEEPGSPGYLTWNDDSTHSRKSAFTTLHVQGLGYWMAGLRDVQIGDGHIHCTEGCGAILDSGTSLIAVPTAVKSMFEDQIGDVTCSDMRSLPDFRFKLDGIQYSLPANSYLAEVSGSVSADVEGAFEVKDTTDCQLSLMTVDMTSSSTGDVWILGMPFFRTFYTVFEQRRAGQPPRMHTALADDTCEPAEASNETSLGGRGRMAVVRRVDAAKVQLPPWLRKVRRSGRLD